MNRKDLKVGRVYACKKGARDPAKYPMDVVKVKAVDLRKWHKSGFTSDYGVCAAFITDKGVDQIVPVSQIMCPWKDWLGARDTHIENIEKAKKREKSERAKRDRLMKKIDTEWKRVFGVRVSAPYWRNAETADAEEFLGKLRQCP